MNNHLENQNDSIIQHINLWIECCNSLEKKLERKLTKDEIIATGVILEERFPLKNWSNNPLGELIEIKENDTKADICYKFHIQLKAALEKRYDKAYTGNFGEESESWKELRIKRHKLLLELNDKIFEFAERAHELGEEMVPLVGVPSYIVPKWVWDNLYNFK